MTRLLPPPTVISQRRVVVTGLGAITPLANRMQTSWDRLLEGKCGIRQLQPSSRADLGHSKVGDETGLYLRTVLLAVCVSSLCLNCCCNTPENGRSATRNYCCTGVCAWCAVVVCSGRCWCVVRNVMYVCVSYTPPCISLLPPPGLNTRHSNARCSIAVKIQLNDSLLLAVSAASVYIYTQAND